MKFDYVTNPNASVVGPRNSIFNPLEIERAVHRTREIVNKFADFEVNVFEILGMRNLSAFVGEVFAASMIIEHPEMLRKKSAPRRLSGPSAYGRDWEPRVERSVEAVA